MRLGCCSPTPPKEKRHRCLFFFLLIRRACLMVALPVSDTGRKIKRRTMRRVDLVHLADRVAASFCAQVRAVTAEEDSDKVAEEIVAHTERENGGDLCTEEGWLEDATQIDRADLRELVVAKVAERIRAQR